MRSLNGAKLGGGTEKRPPICRRGGASYWSGDTLNKQAPCNGGMGRARTLRGSPTAFGFAQRRAGGRETADGHDPDACSVGGRSHLTNFCDRKWQFGSGPGRRAGRTGGDRMVEGLAEDVWNLDMFCF